MNHIDPNDPEWLAGVRAAQTPASVELEAKLRTWLEEGTLPTLAMWHGKRNEYLLSYGRDAGGDCEITAFALYRDLRRGDLDGDWTLVAADLPPVGLHYWNVYRPEGGEAQAVNVNIGRVFVIPLSVYLASNRSSEAGLNFIRPKYANEIYAAASRFGDGRGIGLPQAAEFDRITSEAFGMPLRFPPEFHEAAAREAIE